MRDIIDIDSTYEDFEASEENEEIKINKKNKDKDKDLKKENLSKEEGNKEVDNSSPNPDDDEFNVSLAKMEEEIKPKIINTLESLNKNYLKLQKYQKEKLTFCH